MNKLFYTGSIDTAHAQYESSYAEQDNFSMKKLSHTGCIDMVSPPYESSYVGQD